MKRLIAMALILILTAAAGMAETADSGEGLPASASEEPASSPMEETAAETEAGEPDGSEKASEEVLTLLLDLSPGMPLVKSHYLSEWHYADPTIEMEARQDKDGTVLYWVAEVEVRHPTQIRTMPANSFTYASTAAGNRLARRANAVLACDGDFWHREVKWKGNYVLRQGEMFMHELTGFSDLLLIDEEGDFHIVHKATEETAPLPDGDGKVYYQGKRIYNGLCFGPALVEDGEALVVEPDEHMITDQRVSRLAICQTGKLKYMIVSCYNGEQGLNLQDFAYLCESLGAKVAYNLDGGNSSMIFTGPDMINRNYTVREIADIIYFASAWPEEENP